MRQQDIDGALRHIERIREGLTRDYERAMRKLDNDERDLLGLKRDDEPADAPAFHGAQCPSYPNCTGGCGLGCTHEIETRQRAHGVAWADKR